MPSLNNDSSVSQSRQSRGMVIINNIAVPFISWDVENTTHYHADTFKTTLAVQSLPPALPLETLLTTDLLTVQVLAGFPANIMQFSAKDLQPLIIGRADSIDFDPIQNTVTLSGRDYSSVFIDSQNTEKWSNKRVSDIVTTLAARHQMNANLGDSTDSDYSGFVGNAYHIDKVRISAQRSEWDILTWLASETGYIVYVRGLTLYFTPPPDESVLTPYSIKWQKVDSNYGYYSANVQDLTFTRNMSIAKGVSVTVSSQHFKSDKAITVTYAPTITATTAETPASGLQKYHYTIPGLTAAQVKKRAITLYNQLVAHEMTICVTLPGDNILTPNNPVLVSGVNKVVDQLYYPDTISRHMSMADGYTMSFSAKNQSPQTSASTPETQ